MASVQSIPHARPRGDAARIGKYVLTRAITLFAAVVIAVYLTILVANFGGQIDDFIRADIDFGIGLSMRGLRNVTTEERAAIFEERRQAAYEAAGLNTPFVVRCVRWLQRGLTLDWGETNMSFTGGWTSRDREIREIIFESLPRSLLVFGTANLLLFLTTILVALPLTNKQRGWLDKVIITLSPLSAVPAWIYGILLNLVSLTALGNVFAGSAFDAWPDTFKLAYAPMIMRHLVLPLLAIFLSGLFQGIYTWRTFFQLHAAEDYVELARAKGLPARMLERRHILRPMLPALLTSFSLILVSLWEDVILLEQVFNVTGIGALFFRVVGFNVPSRTPFIVALVVTFAYLLAITVFALDIAYAIVDPRIRVIGQDTAVTARKSSRRRRASRRVLGAWIWRALRAQPRHRTAGAWESSLARPGVTTPHQQRSRAPTAQRRRQLDRLFETVTSVLRQLPRYPAALIGLLIITGMVVISVYAVIAIPYDEMLLLWREGDDLWAENPKNAWPAWVNRFRDEQLPETIRMDSRTDQSPAGPVTKSTEVVSDDMTEITLTFPFTYKYDDLPQEVAVAIDAIYDEKHPLVVLTWVRPDGVEIEMMSESVSHGAMTYRVSQDTKLQRRLRTEKPLEALLYDPYAYVPVIEKGVYKLRVSAYVFEEDADVETKLIVFGKVFGIAGTDGRRRDLSVPLLWGMSVALGFGLVAALVTTVSSVLIAAVGTWLGGWVDVVVQRITEVNMILPFLPVAILVFVLYSKSIWVILGVTVLLSIFGSSIKNYRALFLQVRESPYIEAAICYGASHGRIIVRYLIPRIVSVLIPQVVILVPSYVFLEASLAFLGVSDPVLPTWGKLIVNGLEQGLYTENYHLILEPIALLMLVSFAFVMVGISLQRIFKPTVRFT